MQARHDCHPRAIKARLFYPSERRGPAPRLHPPPLQWVSSGARRRVTSDERQSLSSKLRKEDAARKIAERDGIVEGLVCVFSALEPCRTFSLRFTTGQPCVQSAKRKCLHLYYYFIDRDHLWAHHICITLHR